MDRCKPFRGGRKLFIVCGLLLFAPLISGCAYDALNARAGQAESRSTDLQRQNNQLESRLAVRQGEIRELQRKYSELQISNEQLQDELRSHRPAATELMDGAGVTSASLHSDDEETGFEGIESVEVRRDGDQIRLTLPQHVLFAAGKASLRKDSHSTLRLIADALTKEHKNKPGIRVEGHTDSSPVVRAQKQFPSNWELSSARASSVLRELGQSEAIDLTSSYVVGYGAERPVAANDSEEGRRANRRVEIVILP